MAFSNAIFILTDFLKTVALRFPIMYGEEERVCFTKMIALSEKWNGQIPKIAGDGGKHQLIYAGMFKFGVLNALFKGVFLSTKQVP